MNLPVARMIRPIILTLVLVGFPLACRADLSMPMTSPELVIESGSKNQGFVTHVRQSQAMANVMSRTSARPMFDRSMICSILGNASPCLITPCEQMGQFVLYGPMRSGQEMAVCITMSPGGRIVVDDPMDGGMMFTLVARAGTMTLADDQMMTASGSVWSCCAPNLRHMPGMTCVGGCQDCLESGCAGCDVCEACIGSMLYRACCNCP